MPDSFSLIVNPAAGGGRALVTFAQAAAELGKLGADYQVARSESLDHARHLAGAAAAAGQVVVAVGGDGMAGALAGVAAAGGATFGIIPAGRGNDLARGLGIPAGRGGDRARGLGVPVAPRRAARLLVRGRPRQVDLIAVGTPGRPDRVVAGSVYAGLPAVAGQLADATRWLPGPVVYPAAALRALAGWRPVRFRLEPPAGAPRPPGAPRPEGPLRPEGPGGPLRPGGPGGPDGPLRLGGPAIEAREFSGYAVVVANFAFFGAGMRVAPGARPDDGILDIVTMRDGPRVAFLRVLLTIRSGRHMSRPQVGLDRAAAVTLTMDRALPVGADGEPLDWACALPAGAPLTIRVLPGALTVLAPPASPATHHP